MTAFKSYRITHEYTQTNPANPEKVFPLLCPVREADWLPGWQYQLIHSDSGVAELGCVFTTPDATGDGQAGCGDTTWICVEYEPPVRIAYVWVMPGCVATELRIHLSKAAGDSTSTQIRYVYTGLSEEGNREIKQYDRAWFEAKMRRWERAMNHYLKTGSMIAA